MSKYICKYAQWRSTVLYKNIWCTKINGLCECQRYCPQKNDMVHTSKAEECRHNNIKEQTHLKEME